jgi:glycosyltransferase involved in cell wall biosynthesis
LEGKILFLKYGGFSKINDSVLEILKKQYPQNEIEVFDAWEFNKHRTSGYHYIINIYFFLSEYGIHLITGQKKWKELFQWFFATSYISVQINRKVNKLFKGKNYKFSFQTQSIFNGKIENIPNFIYTDHTTKTNLLYPDINPHQYMRSKRFIEKSEMKTYQDATIVFTFGNLVAQSVITQYQIPKEKVIAVYSGSNVTEKIDDNIKKDFSKNILFVGVEWKRKGGEILLKVFEEVLKYHPDASLTIVGCSPKNIKIPNCKVVGKIPLENVAEYYKYASIFCLPTMREPFGIVFVEAMNYKLPIIANNIGCLPDLVKNDFNGYLIDNNVQDYTKAICKLFENPIKCQQLGENGYQYAQKRFKWEIVGDLMRQHINTALGA